MIVTCIETSCFAKHDTVRIELPRRGLVVVTGRNGQGKSTVAEAVAQGVWNQPIRKAGAGGWRVGASSGVRIEFEGGYVRRLVSKKKHELEWRVGEDGAGEYPTRTKSQTELETHVGSFNVWRHACMFHTKDAATFTDATDAERKRLLEDVLELSRVEKAYRDGMQELRDARVASVQAVHTAELTAARVDSLVQQRDLLTGELETVTDIEVLRTAGRELKRQKDEQEQHVAELQSAVTSAHARLAQLGSDLGRARQRVRRFAEMRGVCKECEQELAQEHVATQVREAQAHVAELEAAQTKEHHASAQLEEAVARARAELDALGSAYAENVAQGREAVAAQRRNEERSTKTAELAHQLELATTTLQAERRAAAGAATYVAELEASTQALSYTGARAGALAGAVAALEEFANSWLVRLGLDGLMVSLGSQSATRGNKVTDKISFDVHGAGGGLGYQAASTGEQRRIDIAMLLAIGELAADSRGLSQESTMFVDELFDGLDHDGVAAVVALLRELALERCVVVITHSERLITSLAPDLHLVAENGTISGNG